MSSKLVRGIAIVLSVLCFIGALILGEDIADFINIFKDWNDRISPTTCSLILIFSSALGLLPFYIFADILENQEDISSHLYSLRVDFDNTEKKSKKDVEIDYSKFETVDELEQHLKELDDE